jgi:hypothetical protein
MSGLLPWENARAWGKMKRLEAENARLKEEVERLTKAGDAMDAYLKRQDGTTNGMLNCRLQWNAAKEGKGQP